MTREAWTETRNLLRCNVYLPAHMIDQLDDYAREEQIARNELIRRALGSYIKLRRKEPAQPIHESWHLRQRLLRCNIHLPEQLVYQLDEFTGTLHVARSVLIRHGLRTYLDARAKQEST